MAWQRRSELTLHGLEPPLYTTSRTRAEMICITSNVVYRIRPTRHVM